MPLPTSEALPTPEVPEIWPGQPHPLGATYDGAGVNFALFSRIATRVEICLFDPRDPSREIARHDLPDVSADVWHGYVPHLQPGALYGYRVHGPYDPPSGARCNPAKLLIDPYARAIHGNVDWAQPVYGYKVGGASEDLERDDRDSAAGCPRSVVVASHFDWGDDRRPNTPWRKTIIYEAHVRGMTMRHPRVPEHLRGTYAALALPVVIDHLRELGVTAIELLPVHEAADDSFLKDRGLRNYWGYSTLSYFAPEQLLSSRKEPGAAVNEFRQMVKALHAADIEVILDVVYNHTSEGNHLGPTLSLKGIDNASYYWLMPDPRYYLDFTGCGNSLKADNPAAARLIVDSLRLWATEMRVDGFRFDLATTLGRVDEGSFDPQATLFQIINQDPVLSQLKLIAEPWDCGLGGYQVGAFPAPWHEWNGKYRDSMRRFWRGEENQAGEVGYRFTGSADLYQLSRRRPQASVNYVTCHDGFTLHDLVTYSQKHNEANGEHNRDGHDDNHAWNCGVEGETSDPSVVVMRDRQKRNMLASVFLSQGVPMLCGGDEIGRTQRGNNNAYCQDNEISWFDWDLDDRERRLYEFTRRLIALRKAEPVLQRRKHFQGQHIWDSQFKDLAWFRPDGTEMAAADWKQPFVRSLGFVLGGDAISNRDEHGQRVVGDALLVLVNAHWEPVTFKLPASVWGMSSWRRVLDTRDDRLDEKVFATGEAYELVDRSMAVLRAARG